MTTVNSSSKRVNGRLIAGAHPSMSPDELASLARLNAGCPSGAREAPPRDWPAWTDRVRYAPTTLGKAVRP